MSAWPRPSRRCELLRSLSDEHVLRALMAQRQADARRDRRRDRPLQADRLRERPAARATPASSSTPASAPRAAAGSAPTTRCPRRPAARWWSSIAPEGVVAEAVDVYGDVVARSRAREPRARRRRVARTLRVAGEVAAVAGPVRLAVVSAADPVDRETGRLVELPDAPFLVGALDRAGRAGRPGRRARHRRQRRQLGRPRRARARRDFAYVLPRRGPRLRGASATARSGAATPASPARSRTWSTAGPGGRGDAASPTSSRRSACAARARPRSTCRRCCAPSSPSAGGRRALASAVGRRARRQLVALADPAVVLARRAVGPRSARARRGAREFARRRAMSRSKPPPSTTSRRWPGPRDGAASSCATRSSPPRPRQSGSPDPSPAVSSAGVSDVSGTSAATFRQPMKCIRPAPAVRARLCRAARGRRRSGRTAV